MYGHTYSKSMDQPGKGASPARGQLNRGMNISLFAFVPENVVSREGFGSPVPNECEKSINQSKRTTVVYQVIRNQGASRNGRKLILYL